MRMVCCTRVEIEIEPRQRDEREREEKGIGNRREEPEAEEERWDKGTLSSSSGAIRWKHCDGRSQEREQ